jgi:hypothetical protein
MSDIVFILGAGASEQCGAPLMANFLDVARNLLNTRAVDESKEDFERVFRAIGALQKVHSKSQLDLNNIESIFTALEISKLLGKLPDFKSSEIPQVISSLKILIVKTLEATVDFPFDGSSIGIPVPYGEFANLLKYLREEAFPRQTVSVITFNYDIAVDMALFKAGMGPDYGIPPDPNCSRSVPLFKLHGSLNWATRKNDGAVYPLQLDQYFGKYSAHYFSENGVLKVPIGSHLSEYFSKNKEIEPEKDPVIVPPSWNKADHHQALTEIWARAAEHLGEAKSIFIVGYSLPLTDAFFRLLFALGTVGPTPLEKLTVYNPDETGEVNKRFRELLGPGAAARYKYYQRYFNDAIVDIKALFQPVTGSRFSFL